MTALTPAAELATKNTIRHPNESEEYRRARHELLVEEIELRRHVERIASLRRDLPRGGEVPEDYHFVAEDGSEVSLADMFGDHHTLIIYSYMFGTQREAPCPMCTSLMGGLDDTTPEGRGTDWPTMPTDVGLWVCWPGPQHQRE